MIKNARNLPRYSGYLLDIEEESKELTGDAKLLDEFCNEYDIPKAHAVHLLLKLWDENRDLLSKKVDVPKHPNQLPDEMKAYLADLMKNAIIKNLEPLEERLGVVETSSESLQDKVDNILKTVDNLPKTKVDEQWVTKLDTVENQVTELQAQVDKLLTTDNNLINKTVDKQLVTNDNQGKTLESKINNNSPTVDNKQPSPLAKQEAEPEKASLKKSKPSQIKQEQLLNEEKVESPPEAPKEQIKTNNKGKTKKSKINPKNATLEELKEYGLIKADLGRRFGFTGKNPGTFVGENLKKGDAHFAEWSASKDPNGLAWEKGEDKKLYPVVNNVKDS